jgi:hypothetical protein
MGDNRGAALGRGGVPAGSVMYGLCSRNALFTVNALGALSIFE